MDDLRPPRDNIVRAIFPGPEVRDDSGTPKLVGHFAVFDQWTRIDSSMEGTFMERIAPGAFARTFNGRMPKVLFNHGKDPTMGNQALGVPSLLEEDGTGARYEIPLLDGIPPLLLSGLKAGAYGASFRFSVLKENLVQHPARSATNPDAIPERTVMEAQVYEFGPVTFPAYIGATAGVRSMTDEFAFDRLTADPARLQALVDNALPGAGPDESHSDEGTRDDPPEPEVPPDEPAATVTTEDPPEGGSSDSQEIPVEDQPRSAAPSRTERPARIKELKGLVDAFRDEHSGVLSAELQAEWNGLTSELRGLVADEEADAARINLVLDLGARAGNIEAPVDDIVQPKWSPTNPATIRKPSKIRDIYSLGEIRAASNGVEDERQLIRESARRAIDDARFPHMDRAAGQEAVTKTLDEVEDRDDYVAHRILLTGNPVYRRALHKTLIGQMLNVEELTAYSRFQEYERAMGQVTGSAGGFGVTFDLDPTMIQTSNGAVVPYRRACRVVTTTTNEWRGVTSGGVTASYAAEAAVGTDNSPTLAQPAALVQKAHCFVPFSMEIQGDYAGLEAELGREIQDAKDVLEAVQFTTGAGTTVFPQGIVTGASTAFTTATTLVLAAADLYGTEFTLAPRFRVNAAWFANRAFYNRIRAIDTAGGAQLWTQDLTVGLPNNKAGNTGYKLLGYPANEASGFSTSIASTTKMAVFGDPNYFVIVDRVGLNLELVPILTQQATAGTGFGIPTGQRGVYAWWRNTSKVLSASAFLTVTGL